MFTTLLVKALAPVVVASSGFVLVINRTDGTTVRIPTSEVAEMQFVESAPLATPAPKAAVDGTKAVITWTAVDNASLYSYKLDNNPLATTRQTSVTFENLTVGSHTFSIYCSAEGEMASIFQDSAPADVKFTVEDQTPTPGISTTPGAKGSVFPPGVSREGGWIDVDKRYSAFGGNSVYGSDNLLCWACSAAGVLQWWLNDYERVNGTPYPLAKQLAAESQFYTTPVMDELTKSFKDRGYDIEEAIRWFAEGLPTDTRWNGETPFKTSYSNCYGNFMGMPKGKIEEYLFFTNMIGERYEYGKMDAEEFKIKLSRDLIDFLQEGPMGIGVVQASHAINLWGVEYEVDAKGNPIVTHFHITENTGGESDGNKANALQTDCAVSWGKNQYGSNRLYYMHPARTPYNCEFTHYSRLKSWKYITKDW